MKAHRQQLMDELQGFSSHAKALFAFLCAERLRVCYWAFQKSKGADPLLFFSKNEEVYQLLAGQAAVDADKLADLIGGLQAIMPNGGEPLAVQAQSAVFCALAAAEILTDRNPTGAIDAANSVVDALDNYDFFVRRRLKGDMSSPTNYPLLGREILRQLADVTFVRTWDQERTTDLVSYRIENLQYVVPVAV